jgi:tetratricopeptide (TPR) repeat protein
LEIVRKVGDQHLESTILNSLGAVYIRLPNAEYQNAINYCQQSLNITHQVGDYLGKGVAIVNLSYCYGCSKQHSEAIKYSEQAMNIADEISNEELRGFALASLANTYWYQKQYFKGLLLATRSMLVLQPWQSANAQIILSKALEEISKLVKRISEQLMNLLRKIYVVIAN